MSLAAAKVGLKSAIKGALQNNQKPNGGSNPEEQITMSIEDLAQKLTEAIHSYVTSAQIITPHGPGSIQ